MSGDAEAAAERRSLAAALRDEVRDLLIETGLLALVQQRFGDVTVTGSAGYDLMVWRDIDLDMPCDADSWDTWMGFGLEVGRELAKRGLVLHRATYGNDYVEPEQGGGFSWTMAFNDTAGAAWSLKLRGWEPFDYAVRQARDANLRADLGGADRDLILRLKHDARERGPYYAEIVTSFDIYEFVIGRVGETLEELEAWRGLA